MRKLLLFIYILTAFFLSTFLLLAIVKTIHFSEWAAPILALLTVLGLILWRPKLKISNFWFAIILAIATVLPRIWWIIITDIPLFSDYKTYHETALALINSAPLPDVYIAKFPHIFGYSLILSALYTLFGSSIIVAQLFGIACTLASACLIWRMTNRSAAIAFALLPSTIFYSPMVSTEPIFTLLFLLCVYLLFQKKNAAIIGMVAAFCNAIRPLAIIFLIAATVYILIRKTDKRAIANIAIMLVTFIITSNIYMQYVAHKIEMPPAKSSFGYTFLVGTNIDSYGMWNEEDSNLMAHLHENEDFTLDEVNKILRNKGFERIKANLGSMPLHYVSKNAILWASDAYGVEWNQRAIEANGGSMPRNPWIFVNISEWYYQVLLMFALITTIQAMINPNMKGNNWFFTLILLGFIGSFMLAEVQGRYHYPALPIIVMLATSVKLPRIIQAN